MSFRQVILLIAYFLFSTSCLFAQGEQSTLQVSGVIIDGDSTYGIGIPGVHVYIKGAGRGTVSNAQGFFSIPTVVGDTLSFSAIGYESKMLVVPTDANAGLTVVVDLRVDITYLPIIEVFPYPTKEIFKEAFLALDMSDTEFESVAENLNQEALARLAYSMPMSSGSNHRYFMQQQINRVSNRNFSPAIPLLNPFAWAEFIKSIKRGDLKKK